MHVSVLVFVRCRAVVLVGVAFRTGVCTLEKLFVLANGRRYALEYGLRWLYARQRIGFCSLPGSVSRRSYF